MTLGTGLGIALHTILTNWTSYINIGQIPSLKLDHNGVSIAYQTSRDSGDIDLIPVNIDKGELQSENNYIITIRVEALDKGIVVPESLGESLQYLVI